MEKIISKYTGSKITYNLVRQEIEKRYGKEPAELYNPYNNCLTYREWINIGYKVKEGERAIKSKIFIEKFDHKNNKKISYFKNINLFYILQVEKNDK